MTAREKALQDIKGECLPYGDCVKYNVEDDYVRPSHLVDKHIRFGFNEKTV